MTNVSRNIENLNDRFSVFNGELTQAFLDKKDFIIAKDLKTTTASRVNIDLFENDLSAATQEIKVLYAEKINSYLKRYGLTNVCKAVATDPIGLPRDNNLSDRITRFSLDVKIQFVGHETVSPEIPLTFFYRRQENHSTHGFEFFHHDVHCRDNFLDLILSNPLKKQDLYNYFRRKLFQMIPNLEIDGESLAVILKNLASRLDIDTTNDRHLLNLPLREIRPSNTLALQGQSLKPHFQPPPQRQARQSPENTSLGKEPTQAQTNEAVTNTQPHEIRVISLDALINAEDARLKKMSLSGKRKEVQLGRALVYTKDSLDKNDDDELPLPSFKRIAVSEATLVHRYKQKYRLEQPVENMMDLYRDAKKRNLTRDAFYTEFLKDTLAQLFVERGSSLTAADIIALHNKPAISKNLPFVIKDAAEGERLFRSNLFINSDERQSKLTLKEQINLLSRIDLRHVKQSVSLPSDVEIYAPVEANEFKVRPSNNALKKVLLRCEKMLAQSEGCLDFKNKEKITYKHIRREADGSTLSLVVNKTRHDFNSSDISSLLANMSKMLNPKTHPAGFFNRIKSVVLYYLSGGLFFNKTEQANASPDEKVSLVIQYAKNNPNSRLAESLRAAITTEIEKKENANRVAQTGETPETVVAETPGTQNTSLSHTTSSAETPAMPLTLPTPLGAIMAPAAPSPTIQALAAESTAPVTRKLTKDEIDGILADLRNGLNSEGESKVAQLDRIIESLKDQSIVEGQIFLYILGNSIYTGILPHLKAIRIKYSNCKSRVAPDKKSIIDNGIRFFENIAQVHNTKTASNESRLFPAVRDQENAPRPIGAACMSRK